MTKRSGQRRSCVVLILDGLGDCPVPVLGGRTPLEAARTPSLDRLAAGGRYGLVDPVARGQIPNTHTGVGLLFGLKPDQLTKLKRGPVEAAGAGIDLLPGDVALRANLATLEERDDGLHVTDRRAGRVTLDSGEFAAALREIDLGEGVKARFYPTDQHRGALVFRGPGLEADLGDTDPGDGPMPARVRACRALAPGSAFAAAAVDRFVASAHERLRDHPLNRERARQGKPPVTGVITRGAGPCFRLESVLADRGIDAVLVAGCNTVVGLARTFGLSTIRRPGFTAGVDTDIRAKLAAAREALAHFPLVYVHIKAPDLFSHDFHPRGKMEFIEHVDSALEILGGSGAALALASDHTTDSNTGAHTADPVPVLFCGPGGDKGKGLGAAGFGESVCRDGTMPRRTSREFLAGILDYLTG